MHLDRSRKVPEVLDRTITDKPDSNPETRNRNHHDLATGIERTVSTH